MTDKPHPLVDATNEVINIFANTSQRLIKAENLILQMEASQKELMAFLDGVVKTLEDMQIKENAWRFKAEELEVERNRWQAKAEELEYQLRTSRRRAAELAYRLGELRCPNCGSENLALLHGNFPTGVTAPDGGGETRWECALDCQECGHKEEVAP